MIVSLGGSDVISGRGGKDLVCAGAFGASADAWSSSEAQARVWFRVRGMSRDPTVTDPDKYKVVFENDRVRVLEYKDKPGDRTSPHHHPDSVMYTLSSFERRLTHGDRETDVQLEAGRVGWLAAQEHHGENIGTTDSHALFVELKEPAPDGTIQAASQLGPSEGS